PISQDRDAYTTAVTRPARQELPSPQLALSCSPEEYIWKLTFNLCVLISIRINLVQPLHHRRLVIPRRPYVAGAIVEHLVLSGDSIHLNIRYRVMPAATFRDCLLHAYYEVFCSGVGALRVNLGV